jgi:hypothetical protein
MSTLHCSFPCPSARPRLRSRALLRLLVLLVGVGLVSPAFAQATGVVSGRVFHAATSGYVRNAEVRVEGTNLVAYTESSCRARCSTRPQAETRW